MPDEVRPVSGTTARAGVGVRVDLAVDVVLVVDPTCPGASWRRSDDGSSLLDVVSGLATAETGTPVGPPVDEPSVTGAVDALVAVLRARADCPLAVVDAATMSTVTAFGDVVADPRPDAGLLLACPWPGTSGEDAPSSPSGAAGPADAAGAASGPLPSPIPVVVRVPSSAREAVAAALPGLLAHQPAARVLDLLSQACHACGVPLVDRTDPAFAVWWLDGDADLTEVRAALDATDERSTRGRRAQRSDDGFLSTFLVRPLSRRLTPLAVARGLRPTVVTVVAVVLGLLAAAAYAMATTGHPTVWRVLGSLLLLASLVVDCVDGEVARYTRTFSARGGWWDIGGDRFKEYAVYAGLAVGAVVPPDGQEPGGDRTAWWLALSALALLVVRHFVDFGFAASLGRAARGGGGRTDPVEAWSARTSRRPALMWAKRAVIMPVGERTLLLIVLAPIIGVRAALTVQLVLGVVAFGWTTAGRLGRTLLRTSPPPDASTPPDAHRALGVRNPGGERALSARSASDGAGRVLAQIDAGPVPARFWPVRTRAGWLLPALARVVELVGVGLLVAAAAPDAVPYAYAWLAVVSIGLYDVVYRQRLAGQVWPSRWRTWAGWPTRLVLVLAVAVVVLVTPADDGDAVVSTALGVAAAVLLVVQVADTARFWGRWVPSRP